MTVYENSIGGCIHAIKLRTGITVETLCGRIIRGIDREFVPGDDSNVTCKHCRRAIERNKKWKS